MRYRLIALANVVPGREREFEEWHDTVHMKQVLDLTGFIRAERMVMLPGTNGDGDAYRYAIIYEGYGAHLEEGIRRLEQAAQKGALDYCDALSHPRWAAIYRQSESPDANISQSLEPVRRKDEDHG